MAKKDDETIQKILERLKKLEVHATGGFTEGAGTKKDKPFFTQPVRQPRENKPSFQLSVDETYLVVPPGQFRETIVRVLSVNGFDKRVTLSLSQNQPSPGLTVNLADHSLDTIPNGEVATTLRVWSANNASGEHVITVTAKAGGLKDQSVPVTIHVSSPGPGPTGRGVIFGYIYATEPYETEEERKDKSKRKRIPGVEVYIEQMKDRFSAVTDANGYYEIIGIDFPADSDVIVAAQKEGYKPSPARKEITIKRNERKRCDFELMEGFNDREVSKIIYQHSIGILTTDETISKLVGLGISYPNAEDMIKGKHKSRQLYRGGAPGGVPHYARSGLFGKIKEGPAPTVQRMEPKVRSAINSGRRELQKRAKHAYGRVIGPVQKDAKEKMGRVKLARKHYDDLIKELAKQIKKLQREQRGGGILQQASTQGGGLGSLIDFVGSAAKSASDGEKNDLVTRLRDMDYHLKFDTAKENLTAAENELRAFKDNMNTREAIDKLNRILEAEAEDIANDRIRRESPLFDEPTNAEMLKNYLKNEAKRLAFYYGRQYNNWILRGIGWAGMTTRDLGAGMQTWGDVWGLFWDNIKTIIFGPWIWGSLLIFLQFFMISAWVNPIIPGTQFYLYMMPFLLGLFTFMMNIESSRQPMDWITHIISGTLVGFTTILLLVAIWTPQDLATFNFAGSSEGLWYNSWIFFFFIWFIIAFFVGVFQFYRSGGFIIVFQMAIIITIFAYLALGPYSGYYNYVLGEVKPPFVMAFRTVGNAFENIWMLATNPTKWYEQQQRVNIVPETPISEPLALEVKSISSRVKSVPVCEEFAVDVIVRNEGNMDVNNVNANASCNNWCKIIDPKENYLTDEDYIFKPREGTAFTVSKIKGMALEGREAEYHSAKATVKISYTSGTNSSLKLTVIDKAELDARISSGEEPYKPVVAVGKTTPARLSINVGPQPIEDTYNTDENPATLLVSVSNGRSDGNIILKKGAIIRIRVDRNLAEIDTGSCGRGGKTMNCTYESSTSNIINCETQNEYEIKSYDFDSIFYFMCDMTVKDVENVKTGLITAELPNYTFTVSRSVNVALTAPLGILENEELPSDCVQGGSSVSNGSSSTSGAGGNGAAGGSTTGSLQISNVKSDAAGNQANITWGTNNPSTSKVFYRQPDWYTIQFLNRIPMFRSADNTTFARDHRVEFTVDDNENYQYFVESTDKDGHTADTKNNLKFFTTKDCTELSKDDCVKMDNCVWIECPGETCTDPNMQESHCGTNT